MKNTCKAGQYTTNIVIFYGPIVCWGFKTLGQPPCKYLKDCVEEHKQRFSKRKYNQIQKKYFQEATDEEANRS